jgi:hypothetical protein
MIINFSLIHKKSIGVPGKFRFKSSMIGENLLFRINSSINSFTVSTICVYMMIADHGLEANPLV